MKLKYLLSGMLLLVPLAAQSQTPLPRGGITIGGGGAVTTSRLPCKGNACNSRAPIENTRGITPSLQEMNRAFEDTNVLLSPVFESLSQSMQKAVTVGKQKVGGACFKIGSFCSSVGSCAKGAYTVNYNKMVSALNYAVERSPHWNKNARDNLHTFIREVHAGTPISQVMQVIFNIVDDPQEVKNKLVEIQQNCQVPATAAI